MTLRDIDRFNVGADVWARYAISVDSEQVPAPTDVQYEARVVLDLVRLRYVVEELTLKRTVDGPPITGELIRKIPVQTIVKVAVAGATTVGGADDDKPLRFTDADIQRLVQAGATDETLTAVARIYITANLAGDAPAKSVASILEIPLSTAGYWIRRAKDRGILRVDEPDAGAGAVPTKRVEMYQDKAGMYRFRIRVGAEITFTSSGYESREQMQEAVNAARGARHD